VTIVNQATSHSELGDLVTAELCEAFEAEIAFVVARPDDAPAHVVGVYGLQSEEASRLLENGILDGLDEPSRRYEGPNLLSMGARAVVLAALGDRRIRGVVGVARMYEQPFNDAEAALLEAVAASTDHALERLLLADERDRLYREASERAHAARVLGSIGDGVVVIDSAGSVQFWNPAAEAITGLPHDAVVGRPLDESISGWPTMPGPLGPAGDPASPTGHATTVPVNVGEDELWLSVRGVDSGEGTVYAFHDLTEERRLEQRKSDFIATVSHELRTPLTAVHGAAKTLQRDDVVVGGETFRQMLALIAQQSERLASMIDDILLASRVDSPRLVLTADRVDVAELATDVIAVVRAQASERLRFELVAPPGLPPVAADRDKLRQVIANLLVNAVKYSPAGGRVEVGLSAEDGQLVISIRDDGLGIAAADQSLIFEKFHRVDPNMTGGVSGTGLGLYICRELVRRMGGTISVDSKLGEGSTFAVTLPLASGPERAVAP